MFVQTLLRNFLFLAVRSLGMFETNQKGPSLRHKPLSEKFVLVELYLELF